MKFSKKKKYKKSFRWALKFPNAWGINDDKVYKNDFRAILIADFKERIKKYHLIVQDECCCYCKTNLTSRNLETDREHIIPKKELPRYTFDVYNLSVSCKTCNMTMKKERKSHISGWKKNKRLLYKNILDGRNYNFIHPNIHNWYDHIDLYSETVNNSSINIYYPLDWRGKFTYKFFCLDKLEIYRNKNSQKKYPINKRGLHPSILNEYKKYIG